MGILSSPLSRIVVLSVVLAAGFLFAVLAGALYHIWLPLLSAVIFLVSHIPIIVCNQWSSDDFMSESSQYVVDFGKWLSGFLTFSAVILAVMFYHLRMLNGISLALTLIGGVLIHSTVIGFTSYFEKDEELTGFEI